ncbi:transporter [Nitrosophilus alvini]|uniref:transporter n=1 Tax=Nitrosophilus alvini TaxID=2714855 RepID=UPI0019099962|nr:transporter [Nitrosophilus alvini]
MKKYLKKIVLFSTIIAFGTSLSAATQNEDLEKAIKKESQPKAVLTQFERDYVLLKKGQKEFENAFSFSYSSAKQIYLESFAILDPVFLTLGQFGIENIKRHTFSDTISFRYGLRDNIQAEIGVPILYRYDRYSKVGTGEGEGDSHSEAGGIGDVSVSLSYQPIRETDTTPAMITNLSFKFKNGKSPFDIDQYSDDLPLGSGYYSVKAGINLVKTIDPVVVFGGISYSYNIEEDVNYVVLDENGSIVSGLSKIDPGDTISINIGLGYAVSYNFSLGFQFVDDYTLSTEVWKYDGSSTAQKVTVANSTLNSAQFKLTAGWAISDKKSINFGLGMGLTSDSPDYVFEVRFPIRF